MATAYPASPLRYPGGKQSFAPLVGEIISSNGMKGCTYVEPYAGGAGVAFKLLTAGIVSRVILNDKCPLLTSFWSTVFEDTRNLLALLEKARISLAEWHRTRDVLNNPDRHTRLEIGYSFFFQNRTNFSGVINGGVIGGKSQKGKYKLDARFPKERLMALIEEISSYRDCVEIYNMDAVEFMSQFVYPLRSRTFTYCDPPYFVKGQELYLNAYNQRDHAIVSDFLLRHSRSMRWMVSYDDAPQILQLYKRVPLYHFELPYSAHRVRRGREILALSPKLHLPSTLAKYHLHAIDTSRL